MAIVGAAAAVAGAGTSIYGAVGSASASSQIASAQMQQNALAQRQMRLDAQRKQMEVLRQQQRARALGLTRAANQGAMFGSGLQGAYGQIQGEGDANLNAIRENLGLGMQNFALSNQISQSRMNLANSQMYQQIGAGLSSLGGALVTSAGAIDKMGLSGFGLRPGSPYMSPTSFNALASATPYSAWGSQGES